MNKLPEAVLKELAALSAKKVHDIDFSDIPPTSEADWTGAVRGRFYRPIKHQLTVRMDADVLLWLKAQGKGYQTRLNEIARKAMLEALKHHHV